VEICDLLGFVTDGDGSRQAARRRRRLWATAVVVRTGSACGGRRRIWAIAVGVLEDSPRRGRRVCRGVGWTRQRCPATRPLVAPRVWCAAVVVVAGGVWWSCWWLCGGFGVRRSSLSPAVSGPAGGRAPCAPATAADW